MTTISRLTAAAKLSPGVLRSLFPLVLIYAAFLFFNREAIVPLLAGWWNSHEASQGLLIMPVSLWLTLQQLIRRPHLNLWPSWSWVVLFVAASAGIHLGGLMHVQLIEFCSLIIAFVAISVALYGIRQHGRGHHESYFPPLYGLLALPVWDYSNFIFQLGSLKATELFLKFSPIPNYVEGFRIELASGAFMVDAGCSGLRYMVSALAIALLYA
ncbi:MAG: hypothetical protein DRQ54_11170, partial [Gammaproteobacteria bacterium]